MSTPAARMKQWERDLIAERDAQPVVCRCAWCDWSHTGTVQDARDAHKAHRAAEHPDRRVPARRTRHRPYRAMLSETSLDDNIAGARAQGAATWAGAA